MKYENEQQLLADFLEGKEKAFTFIFHRYYGRICLFAIQFVAETKEAQDIAEESFIRLWQGKRAYQNLQHLKGSLYQTARRLGLNYQTARDRRTLRNHQYTTQQPSFEESQLHEIVYAETMAELYRALDSLPPKAQEIIKLTYLEGMSNQEVADKMRLSLQTVKNQKLRGIALLRNQLDKDLFNLFLAGAFLLEKFNTCL